jgi:hypothetical protein
MSKWGGRRAEINRHNYFAGGWVCTRQWPHDGSCALVPRLWAHPIEWLRWKIN